MEIYNTCIANPRKLFEIFDKPSERLVDFRLYPVWYIKGDSEFTLPVSDEA